MAMGRLSGQDKESEFVQLVDYKFKKRDDWTPAEELFEIERMVK